MKKQFCDKCGKEIAFIPFDEYDEIVEKVFSVSEKENQIIQPKLSKKCGKGY